jgi:hypothetical protein
MVEKLEQQIAKAKLRLAKLLGKFGEEGAAYIIESNKFTLTLNEKTFAFDQAVIHACLAERGIEVSKSKIFLTSEGKARLLRALHPDEAFSAQHRTTIVKTIFENSGPQQVLSNVNESPLARLYLRPVKQGKPWLNEHEFQAGERLRSDFEKAQLQPRVSSNWVSNVASKGRSGNVSADLSDFAIDARKRVEAVITALGPDLANVALDICCFLKGLETIERDHGWPPRSAKLMLRTALRELVRHYGLAVNPQLRDKTMRITHWGSDGFRPSL